MYLGNTAIPDLEFDAPNIANGVGDDNTGIDDEDGVTLPASIDAGSTILLPITVTGSGALNAWIDWNGNGIFDSGEQVATDIVDGGAGDTDGNADGTITLSVTAPASAAGGTTYVRFRYSSDTGLSPSGIANDGEVEDYPVAIQPVSTNPDIVLVKRITAINGNRTENTNDTPAKPLNAVINDGVANSADDEANWPTNYLLGELDAGSVKPGDEIEYTVYFLNAGGSAAEDVRICDWIQPNQSFVTGVYGGKDIELSIGGSTYQLTAADDAADRAEVTTVGSLSTTPDCNLSGSANASDNVLVLDVTGTTGDPTGLTTFPNTTGQGTPNNAYGYFRFTTKVNE